MDGELGEADEAEEVCEEKKLIDTSELVNSSNKKNRKWLLCPYCDSKILPPNKGEYLEKEVI